MECTAHVTRLVLKPEKTALFTLASNRSLFGSLRIKFHVEVVRRYLRLGRHICPESTLHTRCDSFPKFYERLYSPLIRLAGEDLPASMEYTFFDIKKASLEARNKGGEEGPGPTKRRATNASADNSPSPDLTTQTVHFGLPKSIEAAFEVSKHVEALSGSLLPISSILTFIVQLIGGRLVVSSSPTLEEFTTLLHAAHLESKFGLSPTVAPQIALFLQSIPIEQLEVVKMMSIVWVDCNQDRELLQLLIDRLNSESSLHTESVFRAFANHIGSLSSLNMNAFLDITFAIKSRESLAPAEATSNDDIQSWSPPSLPQDFVLQSRQLDEDGDESISESDSFAAQELLYAQWPHFRTVFEENFDDMQETKKLALPLTSPAIEALILSLKGNNDYIRHRSLNIIDCYSILSNGRALGLFDALPDSKSFSYSASPEFAIFESLINCCIHIAFAPLEPHNVFQQLNLAGSLGLSRYLSSILKFIARNDDEIRQHALSPAAFLQLPDDLQAAVARYRYANVH